MKRKARFDIDRLFAVGAIHRNDAGDGGEGGGGGSGGDGGQPNPADEIKAQLEAIQAENARLQAKLAEANKHAKAAEREREEAARKKAEAEGNYQQLFQSSEKERESLAAQLAEFQGRIANKEVRETALKMAGELADGANIELLAEFITRRLKFTDEGIKVIDDSGNLTVSKLDDLKKEFSGSARYASLIKGRQSSGGGASGGANSGGGAASEMISRAEFDALDPVARMKFVKRGGKITDQK